MANIAFGNKYFILSKFSTIPKTSKIENDREELRREYNELQTFKESNELQDFFELEKYLNSQEHKSLMAKLEKEKAGEEEKMKKFEDQTKSKLFKSHFKFKESAKLKDHLAFSGSKELAEYENLKEETSKNDFSSRKSNLQNEKKKLEEKQKRLAQLQKSKTVKRYLKNQDEEKKEKPAEVNEYEKLKNELDSPEFKEKLGDVSAKLSEMENKEKRFKQLKKDGRIKKYLKFEVSPPYKKFRSFEQSTELADHLAMGQYLQSAEHKDKYKSASDQLEAEKQKKKQYEDFKNSKKYKWYLNLKDSGKFNEITRWNLVFEDEFSGKKLDTDKWMTRYYWGDKMINDAYALENDKAFPTDGKNIETDGSLKIITKKEKVNGKVWKLPFGFVPRDFDYSTGLVSTAKSHRQKYGKIEAKIKVNFAKPVNYNFWMASEKSLPHVDVLKLQQKKSKVEAGHVYSDETGESAPARQSSQFTGLDVSQDFFIYTLEWSKDKLTWRINDVVVNEQTNNIPDEEMYLVFSSGITGKPSDAGLPASMEVDWVRCFKEVE